ncbi:potassium channel family protein [Microbacterium terricola]|uniref:Metal transporter n=1 Tax=Microbacterium terricola TaxID=344163 RepID=A0ABM8DVC5_9MICO|nr:potassium channel family protein [Microbacterium terricola]UYK39635.1 potassium channel family protein [Microbacterium terricola]BDV29624.1 metal transporter [Microbacterium terricola]
MAEPTASRALIVRGLIRALVSAFVLVALYFLLPLDGLRIPELLVAVSVPLILIAVSAWQISAIVRARYPGVRAIEALAIVAPLYLLLFAAGYFLMATTAPASFSEPSLSRIDTLYFAVTIFATVGFGDISAVTETARLFVTWQMILNLVLLGAGIRLLTFAVRRGRASRGAETGITPVE